MNYSFLSACICITNFHTKSFKEFYGFIFKLEEALNPCQKQPFSYDLRNRCSFFEIHIKMLVLELFVNKVTGLQNYNFVKKRLQHRYFPLNLHFQEHLFYSASGQLILICIHWSTVTVSAPFSNTDFFVDSLSELTQSFSSKLTLF